MVISRISSHRTLYNPSTATRKTNSTPKSANSSRNKTTTISKGVGISVQKKPLKGTNFTAKTNTSNATVLNIVEKGKGSVKKGVVRDASVFRVDGAHRNTNYKHINTNSNLYTNNKIYQSLNHKPISNVTYTAARNYTKIGKYVKVGGRAITALAIVSDTFSIYDSYQSDGNKIGRNTVVTSAGVAGSWVGGIGGAELGAAGGGAIGTAICPGVGTAIGGVTGGIIGGIAGSAAGKVGGEMIAKKIYD